MPSELTRYCPKCETRTPSAPLPQLSDDEAQLARLGRRDPEGFFRRYYCLQCRAIWRSVEVPVDFLDGLLASREEVEELERHVALLRFLMASLRQQQGQAAPAQRLAA
ncbi:MAG: hypothetical protein HYS13_07850 [Planctomycetia bacterium]|nr:hypothetical protein [Planctomycetia bacterium]